MELNNILAGTDQIRSNKVRLTKLSPLAFTLDGHQVHTTNKQQQSTTENYYPVNNLRNENEEEKRQNFDDTFKIVWNNLSYTVKENNTTNLLDILKRKATNLMLCGATTISNQKESCFVADNVVVEEQKKDQSLFSSFKFLQDHRRNIFENINGYIESGKITAFLGPSGAGKTSLLNALTVHRNGLSGQVRVIDGGGGTGDEPRVGKARRKLRVAFIPQKDHLIETLTVRENLMFASQIKNSSLVDYDHVLNVAKIVDALNLHHCLDSLTKDLSGGEYKRLSIGQELLSRPDLLVLDEPTSGMDSLTCKKLIVLLKALLKTSPLEGGATRQALAIVLTIHQPSIEVFHMFDHVYIMARQGRIIYDGDPKMALATVDSVIGTPSTKQQQQASSIYSPASYLMEIASGEFGQDPIERLAKYQTFCFQQQSLLLDLTADKQKADDYLDETVIAEEDGDKNTGFYRDHRLKGLDNMNHSGQFFKHLQLLTKRALLSSWREPLVKHTSAFFYLFLPIVMYTIYPTKGSTLDLCPVIIREMDILTLVSNETSDRLLKFAEGFRPALDNVSMLYLTMISIATCTIIVSSMAFPMSLHITLKEYRNGWYSTTAYCLARALANIPFETILPMLSMILTYYLLGQARSYLEWRMIAMVSTIVLVNMISSAHGLINGVVFMDSVEAAVFVSTSSTLGLSLLSGFMARAPEMPQWIQKVSLTTYYRQAFMGILSIRFGYNKCPCDENLDHYIRSTKTEMRMPDQIRALMSYYMQENTATTTSLQYQSSSTNQLDGFIEKFARALSYGEIKSCDQMKSAFLLANQADGDELIGALVNLIGTLILFHLILIVLVKLIIQKRI